MVKNGYGGNVLTLLYSLTLRYQRISSLKERKTKEFWPFEFDVYTPRKTVSKQNRAFTVYNESNVTFLVLYFLPLAFIQRMCKSFFRKAVAIRLNPENLSPVMERLQRKFVHFFNPPVRERQTNAVMIRINSPT